VAGATEDFDPRLFEVFARFDEDDLDHLRTHRGLLASGVPVFVASEALKRYSGRRMEDTRIYQEFIAPAGVRDGPGFLVALPRGNAVLSVGRSNQKKTGGDFSRECEILTLLLPCFAAGARLLDSIGRREAELEALLDRPDRGFAVMTVSGRELRRSPCLIQFLREEADPDCLLAAMARLVASRPVGSGEPGNWPALRVATARATYNMSAVFCSAGHFAPERVFVVTVERLGATLPSVEQLRAGWGLSEREAQVALMLARGGSNKTIGVSLGIRPATVRTHAERVFAKLGVHTRKAIGLSLLQ
jgi:DNA-binding CsgD family transcriptional regulator